MHFDNTAMESWSHIFIVEAIHGEKLARLIETVFEPVTLIIISLIAWSYYDL